MNWKVATTKFSGRLSILTSSAIRRLDLWWVLPWYFSLSMVMTPGLLAAQDDGGQVTTIPASGLAFTEKTTMKELPAIKAVSHSRGGVRELHRINHDELVAELRKVSGSKPEVFARDEYYHIPTSGSVKNLIKWFEAATWKADVRYRHEIWDCDDYALALTTFGEIAAGHDYDLEHGFAWATISVEQKTTWSRVAAGGLWSGLRKLSH